MICKLKKSINLAPSKNDENLFLGRGGRVVEGARLESVYPPKADQGFESLSLR